jgi:hypothetical protein
MITDNFHRAGKYESLNIELYMCISNSNVFWVILLLLRMSLGHNLRFCDEESAVLHVRLRSGEHVWVVES